MKNRLMILALAVTVLATVLLGCAKQEKTPPQNRTPPSAKPPHKRKPQQKAPARH